jgi:thiamine transport system ATP-binding protein
MGRAALGRVLLQARPVLLLDEPFAALGPGLKANLLTLVAEVALGATVLMVTHDPDDARRFADLSVLVADGVAAAPIATEALFDDPPAALRDYLG